MNERTVRDAFHTAIDRYCNRANVARSRSTALRVAVSVVSVETLTIETAHWIHELTGRYAKQMLGGASATVTFDVVPELPEPGYQFLFHPAALPSQRANVPPPERSAPPPDKPIALLTLRYDADFVWPCRIGTADTWLALGRLTGRPPNGTSVMQLPAYATWLPRGRLLLVRNQNGRFAFGRSGNRPQYEIRVDNVALRPGVPVTADVEGRIEYRTDRSSTLLTYRVDWEGLHVR